MIHLIILCLTKVCLLPLWDISVSSACQSISVTTRLSEYQSLWMETAHRRRKRDYVTGFVVGVTRANAAMIAAVPPIDREYSFKDLRGERANLRWAIGSRVPECYCISFVLSESSVGMKLTVLAYSLCASEDLYGVSGALMHLCWLLNTPKYMCVCMRSEL